MSDVASVPMAGRVSAWLTAMRLPFTTVAVVPFGVGAYLAYAGGGPFSARASLLGIVAVFAICVGCYLLGEVYDQEGDRLTVEHGRSKFAGGTLMVALGVLDSGRVRRAAVGAFVLAAALGVGVMAIHRSVLLFALGVFGAASAILYSTPPVRLVSRGVGEIFIGVCYGWLTLVTGYACANGTLPSGSLLPSLPVALSVFAIILVNEYPDFEPDRRTGKRNLLQRVGREVGAAIYGVAMLGVVATLFAAWWTHRPDEPLRLVAVALPGALALGLGVALLRGAWRRPAALEVVCGLTIVLNHLCSLGIATLVRWH